MAASRRSVRTSALPLLTLLACASGPPRRSPAPVREAPPAPLEALALPAGVVAIAPLRDGRSLTLHADGRLALGRGEAREPHLALGDPAGCVLRTWGLRGIALCPNGSETLGEGAPAGLLHLGGALRGLIPGRDGRSLTRGGACDAGVEHDATRESLACTWSEGRGWRSWSSDRPGVRVLDVYGQRALLRWTEHFELPERPPLAHEVVGLYDIDRGRWLPLEAPDPTARWVCAGFDAEGQVRAIVHTGTATDPRAWRLTGAGERDGPRSLQARPLPFPAEDFDALDDLRMVLVRGAEAVAMRDPERALPIRAAEVLGAPPRRGATRCGDRVACGDDRCVIDGRVIVSLPAARDPLAP